MRGLVVGRRVPADWLVSGSPISITNFPTTDDRRQVAEHAHHLGGPVRVAAPGQPPSGPVLFELSSFVGNIETASTGRIDRATATVTVPRGTRTVTVELRREPVAGPASSPR